MITATAPRLVLPLSGRPPGTARSLLRGFIALALVFTLSSNAGFAQDVFAQDVQVTIIPRALAVSAQAASDAGAQQPAATAPSSQGQAQPPAQARRILLPPGTTLPLGLLRPLSIKSSSARGRGIYLQITFPVTDGSRMVIPPGAYIQAIIEKVTKKRGGNPDLEFELSNASLIFSNGYTVPVAGAVNLVHVNARMQPPAPANSQDQTAALAAASGGKSAPETKTVLVTAAKAAPAMSAVGITPPDLPPLPQPSLGNGPRNMMIAMGVIIGVVAIAGTAIALNRRNDIYVETGTPLEIVLSAPLLMDADQVNSAVQQYSARMAVAPPQIVEPPKRPETCYDPGTPGTPDTVIPGTPPTPSTVIPGVNGMPDTVIPGSPGTPDTVIPGTPGTTASSYPCPK
jgi:hypothetical protein